MTCQTPTTAQTVTSNDGTTIAYEQAGSGPALILVDAAGQYRAFSSFGGLIGLLAINFTVYHYDRRGRGDSGDTPPYAVGREVDDLAALIDRVGGSAFCMATRPARSWRSTPRLPAFLSPNWRCSSHRSRPTTTDPHKPASPPTWQTSSKRNGAARQWNTSSPPSACPTRR
jgi:hypothetical protein